MQPCRSRCSERLLSSRSHSLCPKGRPRSLPMLVAVLATRGHSADSPCGGGVCCGCASLLGGVGACSLDAGSVLSVWMRVFWRSRDIIDWAVDVLDSARVELCESDLSPSPVFCGSGSATMGGPVYGDGRSSGLPHWSVDVVGVVGDGNFLCAQAFEPQRFLVLWSGALGTMKVRARCTVRWTSWASCWHAFYLHR